MSTAARKAAASGARAAIRQSPVHYCVVAANGLRARFFVAEETAQPRVRFRLSEQAGLINAGIASRGSEAPEVRTERNTNRQLGPVHPIGEKRAHHRAEIERRFAHEIAGQVKKLFGRRKSGVMIMAASPRMMGMLRDDILAVLPAGMVLHPVSRDYTALSPAVLAQRLELDRRN